MRPIRIGVLGLGTVGAGVVDLLGRNNEEIGRRAGCAMQVTRAAVRHLDTPRDCQLDGIELTTQPLELARASDVDIIVELVGGQTLAYEAVMAAIDHGKHVVTANKQLIALHGNEIFAAAECAGVIVAFEAAVAGGIPIIKAIRESLAANRIDWVAGIINGTSNFILSRMKLAGADFDQALAQAQELGFAEADPSFDVDGIDAAHKLAILGSIAFGIPLSYEQIITRGIRGIAASDIRYAQELGYHFKHLGIAKRQSDGIALRVHPALVPDQALLSSVEGEKNAVMVHGDAVGPTVYYGAGAGAGPTASAVVADLIDTVRLMEVDQEAQVPHLAFQPHHIASENMLAAEDFVAGHYLRIRVADRTGVMAEITRFLADMAISIECVLQKDPARVDDDATIIIVTKPVAEGAVTEAINKIYDLPAIQGEIVHYHVADFED